MLILRRLFTVAALAGAFSIALQACAPLPNNGAGFPGVGGGTGGGGGVPDLPGGGGDDGGNHNLLFWDPIEILGPGHYLHLQCTRSKDDYRVTIEPTAENSVFHAVLTQVLSDGSTKVVYDHNVRGRDSAQYEGHLNFGVSKEEVPYFYLRVLDPAYNPSPLNSPYTQFGYKVDGWDGGKSLTRLMDCTYYWSQTP